MANIYCFTLECRMRQMEKVTDQRINETTLQFAKYDLKQFKDKHWQEMFASPPLNRDNS